MDPNERVDEGADTRILAAVFDAAFDPLLLLDSSGVITRIGDDAGLIDHPASLLGTP